MIRKPVVPRDVSDDTDLRSIANAFSLEWQTAHGRSRIRQYATDAAVVDDELVVKIHNALSRAELHLVTTQRGRDLVQLYVESLFDQTRPRLEKAVEVTIERRIGRTHIELEPENGCLKINMELI